MEIVLASRSPRRKEILENLSIPFRVVVSDADETTGKMTADEMVRTLSLRKARATEQILKEQGEDLSDTLIIGCDTAVVYDMKILGKPKNKQAAVQMLRTLRGHAHFVVSGLTLLYRGEAFSDSDMARVIMGDIPDEEIEDYVNSKEPMDKAGAYGIQGRAGLWVYSLVGDYFNVMGFPVRLFYEMMQAHDLPIPFDKKKKK